MRNGAETPDVLPKILGSLYNDLDFPPEESLGHLLLIERLSAGRKLDVTDSRLENELTLQLLDTDRSDFLVIFACGCRHPYSFGSGVSANTKISSQSSCGIRSIAGPALVDAASLNSVSVNIHMLR